MNPIQRALDICLKPRQTFIDIEREKDGFTALFSRYILWLAALPPLVKLAVGLFYRPGPGGFAGGGLAVTLTGAALEYICILVGVYALALAVDALAPYFGGERDEDRALRLCAYALTPTYLASAVGAIPGLAWMGVLGIYSVVLVVIGLPRLMRCADDHALPYGASVAVVMAAIALVTSLLTSRVLAQP
jgi:hypothetical protein